MNVISVALRRLRRSSPSWMITPEAGGSHVNVFINDQMPTGWATYWLGRLFGPFYAKWCVNQMLAGVVGAFPVGRRAVAA